MRWHGKLAGAVNAPSTSRVIIPRGTRQAHPHPSSHSPRGMITQPPIALLAMRSGFSHMYGNRSIVLATSKSESLAARGSPYSTTFWVVPYRNRLSYNPPDELGSTKRRHSRDITPNPYLGRSCPGNWGAGAAAWPRSLRSGRFRFAPYRQSGRSLISDRAYSRKFSL